jgi:hypothetical protein
MLLAFCGVCVVADDKGDDGGSDTWRPSRELRLAWTSVEDNGTYCVAWADVDGDGDLDLAVGNKGVNRLYVNEGAMAAR